MQQSNSSWQSRKQVAEMAEKGRRAENRSPIATIKFNGLERGKAAVAWMHNRVQETLQVSSSAFCNSPTPLPISFVFAFLWFLCFASRSLSLSPPQESTDLLEEKLSTELLEENYLQPWGKKKVYNQDWTDKLLNPRTYGYLRRIAVATHDLVTELEKETAAAWRVVRLMVRQ